MIMTIDREDHVWTDSFVDSILFGNSYVERSHAIQHFPQSETYALMSYCLLAKQNLMDVVGVLNGTQKPKKNATAVKINVFYTTNTNVCTKPKFLIYKTFIVHKARAEERLTADSISFRTPVRECTLN